MNNSKQQFGLQKRFSEVFAHLRDQDIEQFYAQYQLWVMRRRIPILENEIETLRGDIATNQQHIQGLRPSALAQAVLARLQAQGVNDVTLLDQLLERGEGWLDRMMQRLDYCEQVGNFIQGDYTQWCLNSLEGAYDWIDTARGSRQEDEQTSTSEPVISEAEAQITAELLLSKLRGEEDEATANATGKQTAHAITPQIAEQFDNEGEVEPEKLASVEGSIAFVENPTYEQALEILGIETAGPTNEDGSIPGELPELEPASLVREEEEQPAPWYSADLEQLESFDFAHQRGMDDWIKILQAETSISPTAWPGGVGGELPHTNPLAESTPAVNEVVEQSPNEPESEMRANDEEIPPSPALGIEVGTATTVQPVPELETVIATEPEQSAASTLSDESFELETSSTSENNPESPVQEGPEREALAPEAVSQTTLAEESLIPEHAPEENPRPEEYGTSLLEPEEKQQPWYEYLLLPETRKHEQVQTTEIDASLPFAHEEIHPTPQLEQQDIATEPDPASQRDQQDMLAEAGETTFEQLTDKRADGAEENTDDISQEAHTEKQPGTISIEAQTEISLEEPETELVGSEETATSYLLPTNESSREEAELLTKNARTDEAPEDEQEETESIPAYSSMQTSTIPADSQVDAANSIETEMTNSSSANDPWAATADNIPSETESATHSQSLAPELTMPEQSPAETEDALEQEVGEEPPENRPVEEAPTTAELMLRLETLADVETVPVAPEIPELAAPQPALEAQVMAEIEPVEEVSTVAESPLRLETSPVLESKSLQEGQEMLASERVLEAQAVPEPTRKLNFWQRLFSRGRKRKKE